MCFFLLSKPSDAISNVFFFWCEFMSLNVCNFHRWNFLWCGGRWRTILDKLFDDEFIIWWFAALAHSLQPNRMKSTKPSNMIYGLVIASRDINSKIDDVLLCLAFEYNLLITRSVCIKHIQNNKCCDDGGSSDNDKAI